MTARLRWSVLLLLLAAAGGLVLFGDESPPPRSDVVAALPRPTSGSVAARQPAAAGAATPPLILALRPRDPAQRIANAFASRDWAPPAPPPAVAPRPVPSAPPLPYKVIGKQLQDGVWQVFLARNELIFIVKPKDKLEDSYRVDATDPPALRLTYLPLQQQQILPIGDAE